MTLGRILVGLGGVREVISRSLNAAMGCESLQLSNAFLYSTSSRNSSFVELNPPP